jgi:transcriptional regulator with XRE-family HTH domain
MTPRDLLAWNVRKLRVERGLSQERLAFEAGLERVSISQLERKQVNLGIDSLGKIAGVLDCKIFELLVDPAEGEIAPENLRPGRRP